VVARPRRVLDQALEAVLSALIAVGALLVLGVSLLVWRSVGRGLVPLERLADQTARIDVHSLQGRFPTQGLPAELVPICTRLNDLLDRLSASFDRERRFSADVAHELRTPLAELRNIAEVAMQFPGGRDPLPDVLGAALQMERLVSALLALSRAEAGRQPVALQPIDLGRLAEETWAPFAPRAAERHLRVTSRASRTVVETDVVLIAAIFGNLFANAVDYTPAGGALEWALSGAGELSVVNDNASLAAADLPHVFERFWRKDAARTDGQHGGLGLSLAQSFARLLGATLTLELGERNRVHARLVIPQSDRA
jgi:signal transduction histidine kinase